MEWILFWVCVSILVTATTVLAGLVERPASLAPALLKWETISQQRWPHSSRRDPWWQRSFSEMPTPTLQQTQLSPILLASMEAQRATASVVDNLTATAAIGGIPALQPSVALSAQISAEKDEIRMSRLMTPRPGCFDMALRPRSGARRVALRTAFCRSSSNLILEAMSREEGLPEMFTGKPSSRTLEK